MTGRATFGDFLRAARRDMGAGGAAGGGSVEEVSRSLLRVVLAMGRHVQDLTAVYDGMPAAGDPALGPWGRAGFQARDALASAAGFLREHGQEGRLPAVPAASPLARRLDAATVSLTAGRDLLHTHFAPGPDGERRPRSEWAAVVTSGPVSRARLAEIGPLARQIAHQSANVALSPSPGVPANADARRKLNAACQWLWALDAHVRQAEQREPVTMAERELLAVIPANALAPRHVPTGKETVAELVEGVIGSAERIRHLAWRSAQQEPWSPAMTVTSLRQVAETSTYTSHNCHLVIQTLAAGAVDADVGAELTIAAEEVWGSRMAWLHTARVVRQIQTETRGYLTPAAAEAADLTFWTGRLAYADPQWTLRSGPDHPSRPPESLASTPEDLRNVIAAVHHASAALSQFAEAEHERVAAAARAGRILVPTRTLTEDFDIPRPYARAPRQRVRHVLAQYRETAQATDRTVDRVGQIASAAQAPSRVLATARAATAGVPASRQNEDRSRKPELERQDPGQDNREMAGPLERTLRRLGVDQPDLIARGAELDRAAERLLVDAGNLDPVRKRPAATALNQSTATAALVNHALASGDPRATALLRRPEPAQVEQAEPEP